MAVLFVYTLQKDFLSEVLVNRFDNKKSGTIHFSTFCIKNTSKYPFFYFWKIIFRKKWNDWKNRSTKIWTSNALFLYLKQTVCILANTSKQRKFMNSHQLIRNKIDFKAANSEHFFFSRKSGFSCCSYIKYLILCFINETFNLTIGIEFLQSYTHSKIFYSCDPVSLVSIVKCDLFLFQKFQ